VVRIITCLLLLFVQPAQAAADYLTDPSLSGSLKSLNLYLQRLPAGSQEGLLSLERLRFELSASVLESYRFEAAIDQQLLWSDPPGFVSLPLDSVNRVVDLEHSWNRGGRVSAQAQIDRFNLRGERNDLQWALGRQAIGFGRISLFSPLDVIAPFPPDALDVDVRPGVDALKVVRYFGLAGQIGGVAVFGDQPQHNSYLLTFSENPAQIDLLLLTGSLRNRAMFGAGLAGELGLLGLKVEASWYRGQKVGQPEGDLQDDFALAALEWWYRFDNGLVLLGEYFYNGPGSSDPETYSRVAVSAPVREGLTFLLGRQYLLLGPSYEFHPLVAGSGLLIWNLEDRSYLLRPQLVLSLADNLQLDLFWSFARGRKPGVDQISGLPVARSEFGSGADSGGLLLRYFF